MTARKYAPTCSFPGCGRPHNARGLCGPHGTMQRQGKPLRPIQNRTDPEAKPEVDRFADKVALAHDDCLIWIGGLHANGYGMFGPTKGSRTQKKLLAHRWSYEHHVGAIPEGLDLDHLCRNRACVNPDHLEPVTRQENIRRAAALKTHCPAGHPYDAENTYIRPGTVHRKCRTCARNRDRARATRRRRSKENAA